MTNEEARVTLRVNTAEAKSEFEALETKAARLRQKLAEAFRSGDPKGIREANRELQSTERWLANMRTNAANVRAALERLDQSTPKQLRKLIADINRELNSGRVRRGSAEWEAYTGQLRRARTQLQSIQAESRATESMLSRLNRRFNEWGAGLAAGIAGFAGLVLSGKQAVQTYADMQAEEANVIKYTGMTAEQVERLNEEFRRMDTRTSRENLNRLAQEAGRLGKTTEEDVMGYVRASDKVNVALDELGEGATLVISKLTGVFGIEKEYGTEQSLLKAGSVINDLAQACSASAPYLVDFSSRLGGIAYQAGMTIDQTAAYGALLDSQNKQVEASATAVGQLITKMYLDPAKIAKAAGMEVKAFTELVKNDMNGALISLFEHLNRMGGMGQLATVFDEMGTDGSRSVEVLSALASHIEELKERQQQAADAFRDGTSVIKEYNVQNNTVQAQLDKSKKRFTEVAVSLGKELLPAMRYAISGTSMLMQVLMTLINFTKQYGKEIAVIAGAVALYSAAVYLHSIRLKAATVATRAFAVATGVMEKAATLAKAAIEPLRFAIDYLRNGMQVTYAMQQRWSASMSALNFKSVIGAATAAAAVLAVLVMRLRDTYSVAKTVAEVEGKVNETVAEQVTKVRQLERVLQDANAPMSERRRALEELKTIMPGYNAQLDTECRLIKDTTGAVNKYIDALKRKARAQAAQEKMVELNKEILDIETEMASWGEDAQSWLGTNIITGPGYQSYRAAKQGKLYTEKVAAERRLERLEEMVEADRRAERPQGHTTSGTLYIAQPPKEEEDKEEGNGGGGGSPSLSGEPDKERKAREKREREAAKAKREAERQAKEELANAKDREEAWLHEQNALNIAAYSTGQINYLEFTEKKKSIDDEYLSRQMKVLEDRGLTETAEYAKLLEKKAKLDDDYLKNRTKAELRDIDKKHTDETDRIVKDYYDPGSSAFQNQTALQEALLAEDVRYLKERRDIYAEGSEEWIEANDKVNERVAQAQLDKQKDLARKYMQYEQEYRKASGSVREKMELAMLDELHRQGLIKEEEYQQAVQRIKDRYREEDAEKAATVHSEYADMVKNLFESFSRLFKDGAKDGQQFWNNLGSAATAAYSVMSAALSSFSAYSDAERDLELAKTEKRYDQEIAAAGDNEALKTKLEEQKEADIAKIKKKYNDRAMKMQIAQALAQTAMAAINAYASALAIGPAGLILAPIAAAMAVAAGMMQVATIKKQHEAQQAGYYSGGFTRRDPDNRREVGVVHANEFVADHRAVANRAIAPVLSLIDHAQRNNTVGSLTADDVSEALGHGRYSVRAAGGGRGRGTDTRSDMAMARMSEVAASASTVVERLNRRLDEGIEAYVLMDGEQGLYNKYSRYKKLIERPAR